jgi:phytoene desaturase
MYAVVDALTDLARAAGVELVFGCTVAGIRTGSNRVHGVGLADGPDVDADIVLANADLPYVYRDLLPPDRTAAALWRRQFSCSAISFFWGLDRAYESLAPHTLFLSDAYRENFEAIDGPLTLARNPSLYVHAPARLDPSMAPAGKDTLTAIVPVGHLQDGDGQDWPALRDAAREHVLGRLASVGIADAADHIVFEETRTPVDWAARYNLAKGATHGLSHRLTQMASFRPPNRHARYRNLYFVGASTHPGTGVPIAMVSGRLVADRIRSELS